MACELTVVKLMAINNHVDIILILLLEDNLFD